MIFCSRLSFAQALLFQARYLKISGGKVKKSSAHTPFRPALLGLPWAGSIPLFLIPLAAYAAAAWKLWRCPHCGERLGRVDAKPLYCPRCGHRLEDFE